MPTGYGDHMHNTLLSKPTDLNALSAIEALLAYHRAQFGTARMEGDGGDENGAGDGDGKDGAGKDGGNGGDAGKTFTQADLDRIVGERLTREKAKYADYDDLKTKAAEADKLRQERETENEKAVREAGETAAAEERAKNAPRLVSAEFRAAAKGVLTPEQTTVLLEDLDLTKYLDDKGEVDVAKVEKKVAAFAPSDDGKNKRGFPDLGQGRRTQSSAKGEGGAAEAARRFTTSK
jgi:hypothetical protein